MEEEPEISDETYQQDMEFMDIENILTNFVDIE